MMQALSVLAAGPAVWLCLSAAGLGLTLWTERRRTGRPTVRTLAVSPVVGLAAVTLLITHASLGGIPLAVSARPITFALLTLSIALAAADRISRLRLASDARASLPLLGLQVVCYGLGVLPLMATAGGLNTVGLGNNDAFIYCNIGRYLRTHPALDPAMPGPHSLADFLAFYQVRSGPRFGCFLLMGFFPEIFGRGEFELFYVLNAFAVACLPPLAFLVCREAFGLPKRWALAGALFVSLNKFMLWNVVQGFQAHALAAPFSVLLFLDLRELLRDWNWRLFARVSVVGAALFTVYPELFPFATVPFAVAVLVRAALLRRWRPLAAGAAVLAGVFAASPVSFVWSVRGILAEMGSNNGFPVGLPWLDAVLGLVAAHPEAGNPRFLLHLVLTLVVAWILAQGLMRARDRLFVASAAAGWGLLLLWNLQRIFTHGLYYYSFLKGLLFILFFLAACFAAGLAAIGRRNSRGRRLAVPAAVLASLAMGLVVWRFERFSIRTIRDGAIYVDTRVVDLERSLARDPARVFYLPGPEPYWHRLWFIYLLNREPMVLESGSEYSWAQAHVPFRERPGGSVLAYIRRSPSDIVDPYQCLAGRTEVSSNLVTCEGDALAARLDGAWYWIERSPQGSFRWMGIRSGMDVEATASRQVRLRLQAAAFGEARTLRVRLDGADIGVFTVPTHPERFESPAFELSPGNHRFELIANGVRAPGGADTRALSVAVYHLSVVPSGQEGSSGSQTWIRRT